MFDQTADLLELSGENPCRMRAYRRAAHIVDGLPQSGRTMRKKQIPSASTKPGAVGFSPSDIINPRPIDELRQLLKR